MANDFNPFSLLEVSLVEDPENDFVEATPDPGIPDPLAIVETPSISDSDIAGSFSKPMKMIAANAKKLSEVSANEQGYRSISYKSLSIVFKKRLHCTICDKHIGCSLQLHGSDLVHPLLKVLICVPCRERYSFIDFALGPTGSDIRCRWCGQFGGKTCQAKLSGLRSCTTCPYSFCEVCIYRNFPFEDQTSGKWVCFVCKPFALWPHRALNWAFVSLLNNLANRKVKEPSWYEDQSDCCRRKSKSTSAQEQPPTPSIKPTPPPTALTNGLSKSQGGTIGTEWLKSKLLCVQANMNAFDSKFSELRDGLPEKDTKENLNLYMESVCSLLALARKQLLDYEADIKLDWDWRRTTEDSSYPLLSSALSQNKVSSEKVGPPEPKIPKLMPKQSTEVHRIERMPQVSLTPRIPPPPEVPFKPISLPKLPTPKVPRPQVSRKTRVSAKDSQFPTQPEVSTTSRRLSDKELIAKYKLKPCSVVLTRCPIPSCKETGEHNLLESIKLEPECFVGTNPPTHKELMIEVTSSSTNPECAEDFNPTLLEPDVIVEELG